MGVLTELFLYIQLSNPFFSGHLRMTSFFGGAFSVTFLGQSSLILSAGFAQFLVLIWGSPKLSTLALFSRIKLLLLSIFWFWSVDLQRGLQCGETWLCVLPLQQDHTMPYIESAVSNLNQDNPWSNHIPVWRKEPIMHQNDQWRLLVRMLWNVFHFVLKRQCLWFVEGSE